MIEICMMLSRIRYRYPRIYCFSKENWLLLQEEGWKELKQFCDYSIFIQAEEDMLKQRLIERKIQGGLSRSEAIAFYERSDGRNVSRVLQHSMQADLTLRLSQDMRFCKEEIK